MSIAFEPNPPSRKDEDFPKTNTLPDGWTMPELMERYNHSEPAEAQSAPDEEPIPIVAARRRPNGRPTPIEELFARRLDPANSDLTGLYL